jgi:hypothetical protein
MRLLKIITQETTEAAIKISMTIFTAMVAWPIKAKIDIVFSASDISALNLEIVIR